MKAVKEARATYWNGALLVDKPTGITSHDVVDAVRKTYGLREVGHAGTLDPIATGLLICLLGEATKLSQYVMSEEKAYRVGILFGRKTDSADISGQIISENLEKKLEALLNLDFVSGNEDFEMVTAAVSSLVGTLNLPVPKYSAVKVDGRKLYEYARANVEVEIPVKEMVIKSANIVSWKKEEVVIDLYCEKGTYVRSWVEKLGEKLASDATVKTLRRISSGPFQVANAVTLATLSEMNDEQKHSALIPVSQVLGGWLCIKADGRDGALIRGGQIPRGILSQIIHSGKVEKGVRVLSENEKLLALIVAEPQKGLKLARVFN